MPAPITFAHRGASGYADENTLPAFRLALQQGATGLESDTWLSSDGIPMLVHDGTVERDGRTIAIRQTPAAELRLLGIPGLADLYQSCGMDYEFSLDIQHPEAAWPVLQVARQAGALEHLWLCHNALDLLCGLRENSPEVKLVHSIARKRITGGIAAHARRLATLRIDALNFHWLQWTPRLVRAVQSAGVKAFAWDAQTPLVMEHALALGVDAIYSNYPDQLVFLVQNTWR